MHTQHILLIGLAPQGAAFRRKNWLLPGLMGMEQGGAGLGVTAVQGPFTVDAHSSSPEPIQFRINWPPASEGATNCGAGTLARLAISAPLSGRS